MNETDNLSMDITATAENGVQIPMNLEITFPSGYGLYAAKALEKLPESMEAIYRELVNKRDASTLEALSLQVDEDDE